MNEPLNQNLLLAYPLPDKLQTALDHAHTVQAEIKSSLDDDKPIAIACSGGADSVFLLCWLFRLYYNKSDLLHVVHFNHGIRSDSALDAEYVEHICKGLRLTFHLGSPDTPLPKEANEAQLREHRHGFFRKIMEQIGTHLLITGHHQDDAIETLILRLGRGSGIEGLSAPREVQIMGETIKHVRPLIKVRKSLIIQALEAMHIPWREDSTNQSSEYTRNAIRNQLLPLWESLNPQDLQANLSNTHALLQEAHEALEHFKKQALDNYPIEKGNLHLNSYTNSPDAILRRIIHTWASLQEIELPDNVISVILEKLRTQSAWERQISTQYQIKLSEKGLLSLHSISQCETPITFEFKAPETSSLYFPDGCCLEYRLIPANTNLIKKVLSGEFSHTESVYISIEETKLSYLTIRRWQPGDQYQPLGMRGSKKLQDCFTDQKIPSNKRKQLPVIFNDAGEILWVPGLLPSERHKVTTATKWLLQLTYLPFSHSLKC